MWYTHSKYGTFHKKLNNTRSVNGQSVVSQRSVNGRSPSWVNVNTYVIIIKWDSKEKSILKQILFLKRKGKTHRQIIDILKDEWRSITKAGISRFLKRYE